VRRLIVRATPVFNADQVDGLQDVAAISPVEELQNVDAFIAATGANIAHGESRAALFPSWTKSTCLSVCRSLGLQRRAQLKPTI
jgi:antirestriction protein ArdC